MKPLISITSRETDRADQLKEKLKSDDDYIYSTTDGSSESARFNPIRCQALLRTQVLGEVILHSAEVASTQEFMRSKASLLDEGTVFVADKQFSGKGRGGNQWTSPAGCLMFTVSKRVKVPGPQAPFLNYLVCLAVVEALGEVMTGLGLAGVDLGIGIKWPNDIYYRGLKIGGALIHTTWSSGQFLVQTGLGLNLDNNEPTTCINAILKEHAPAAPPITAEALLAALLLKLEELFMVFERDGFTPLEGRYLSHWLHSNQTLVLVDREGSTPTSITICGLSPQGFLLGTDSLGQQYELTPDGNSLDLMRGLIHRKL